MIKIMNIIYHALCINVAYQVNAFIPTRLMDHISSFRYLPSQNQRELTLSSHAHIDNDEDHANKNQQKKLILIRHGCTYMNEYLSQKGCEWGDPDFTDIFSMEETRDDYYLDTPLSQHGRNQAKKLYKQCASQQEVLDDINDLDLIVVSPLTRALQTFEIGLYPIITQNQSQKRRYQKEDPIIIALPLAAERLYLVSDIGKPTSLLKQSYPYIDFETGFDVNSHDEWWFTPDEKIDDRYYYKMPLEEKDEGDVVDYPRQTSIYKIYEEWRPNNERQKYAIDCGEPQDVFDLRMKKLLNWIENREEQCIAIICHWGVLQWLTDGDDFDNCELKIVQFDDLVKKKNLIDNSS